MIEDGIYLSGHLLRRSDLSHIDKLIIGAIAAGSVMDGCILSNKTLGYSIGCSDSHVQNRISKLVSSGKIMRFRKKHKRVLAVPIAEPPEMIPLVPRKPYNIPGVTR